MISLRKINSIIVIIIFIMLLNHAVLSLLFLYGVIDYAPDFKITGRRLFYPVILHIIISLYLFISEKTKNNKRYNKLIKDTTQQIITGISILFFMALHIISYTVTPINNDYNILIKMAHFIIDNMLFLSIILHLRISIPRLLISLGFLESKNSYKKAKNYISNILFIILAFLIIAEIIFYVV